MSTSRCGLASAKLTTSAAGTGQSWRQKRNSNLAHEARQGAEMTLAANPLRQERRKGQTGGWPPFDHNARPNLRVDPFRANLAQAEARLDGHAGLVGLHVGAIARGAAAEDGQANRHSLP